MIIMTNFKYVYVDWIHTATNEPYLIVAELDEANFEVRKIEFFKNGAIHEVSTKKPTSGSTWLSIEPWPTSEEINLLSPGEFQAKQITSEDFEHLWAKGNQSSFDPHQ